MKIKFDFITISFFRNLILFHINPRSLESYRYMVLDTKFVHAWVSGFKKNFFFLEICLLVLEILSKNPVSLF